MPRQVRLAIPSFKAATKPQTPSDMRSASLGNGVLKMSILNLTLLTKLLPRITPGFGLGRLLRAHWPWTADP